MNFYLVLGNGLTPSTADVAVYADLHSSVPGLGKAKTAMMLRSRFLGKLPKQGYCKKWITSVDCLMNVGEDTIVSSNIHCLYLWILSTRICHYIELLSLKACVFLYGSQG
ncbi:hypothetical protein F2Q68_00021203 [Brassica cretica]|uniref:Uncharacterized protein n=1 Tax=Brassica cretica TaxID=69181 RepID=A0A8S9G0K8_BRACR|nr:hypothetical protein F2Q68_00021203 [Brassica cretica]